MIVSNDEIARGLANIRKLRRVFLFVLFSFFPILVLVMLSIERSGNWLPIILPAFLFFFGMFVQHSCTGRGVPGAAISSSFRQSPRTAIRRRAASPFLRRKSAGAVDLSCMTEVHMPGRTRLNQPRAKKGVPAGQAARPPAGAPVKRRHAWRN